MSMNGSFVQPPYAPFMVVNPGETLLTAMARHRRDTGHRGGLIIVGCNRGNRTPDGRARYAESMAA